MKYRVMVGGTVVGEYEDKDKAEVRLNEVRNSFYALVHPYDTMFIKEVGEKE